ncbi:MAG: hypothetical protein ACN4EP_04405, partial [Sediminibacterium sp.]
KTEDRKMKTGCFRGDIGAINIKTHFPPDFRTPGLPVFFPVETNMPEKIAYLTKSIFLRL